MIMILYEQRAAVTVFFGYPIDQQLNNSTQLNQHHTRDRERISSSLTFNLHYQHYFSLLAIDFNLNPILSTIITEVFRTMDHHLLLHDDDEDDSMDRESANKRRKRSVSDDGNLLSSDPNSASDSMNHPSGNEVVDCDDEEDFFLSLGLGWEDAEDGDWDETIHSSSSPAPFIECNENEPSQTTNERMKRSQSSTPTTPLPLMLARRQSAHDFYIISDSSRESSEDIHDEDAAKGEPRCHDTSHCSLGNNLMISIRACNYGSSRNVNDNYGDGDEDNVDESGSEEYSPTIVAQRSPSMPIMPLITPPSSPRRIQVVLSTLDDGSGVTTTIMEEEATICEWPCNLTVDNAITAALELVPPVSCVALLR